MRLTTCPHCRHVVANVDSMFCTIKRRNVLPFNWCLEWAPPIDNTMAKLPKFLNEDRNPQGEGLTRTSHPGAKLWDYRVRFDRSRPMTGKIPAVSRGEAHRFLLNRHPNAVLVEVGE